MTPTSSAFRRVLARMRSLSDAGGSSTPARLVAAHPETRAGSLRIHGMSRRTPCLSCSDPATITTSMPVSVRPMQAAEARRFLEIHHDSVRGLAGKDYPPSVIDAWVPIPITDERLQRFLQNCNSEIRLIAERDGDPVGIGAP